MATTQPTPAATATRATVGVPFTLSALFGPGGSANLTKSGDPRLLRINGISAKSAMDGDARLDVEFMPLATGTTEVIFLVDPRGIEPLETQRTYQIVIGVPE